VTAHLARLDAVENAARIANLVDPLEPLELPVTTVFLPVLFFAVPVFAIVFLAVRGRGSSGACDAMLPDGSCRRCGRPAVEIDATQRRVPEQKAGDSSS
jgi:hypothetical protein